MTRSMVLVRKKATKYEGVLTLLERVQPKYDEWDRQMIADAEAGRLDSLIDQALEGYEAGDSSDLFEGLKL